MTTYHFTLSGKLHNGKRVTVRWEDGAVTASDPDVAEGIKAVAALYEGRPVRKMPAAATYHDHLANPYSAYALIERGFADKRKMHYRGNVPRIGADLADGEVM